MSETSIIISKIIKHSSYLSLLDYQNTAKLINIDINNKNKSELCSSINSWINSKLKKNKILKEYFNNSSDKINCQLFIQTIKELSKPDDMPIKAPIPISQTKYKELIEKRKSGKINKREMDLLEDCLHIKYCYCVKRRILLNELNLLLFNKPLNYNPWQTCSYSVYKSRGFPITENASLTCRSKYSWYN